MPEYAGQGVGRQLVNMFLQKRVVAYPGLRAYLPTKVFEKCGFKVISKESLPKVWKESSTPQIPHCEEIAMIYSPMATTG